MGVLVQSKDDLVDAIKPVSLHSFYEFHWIFFLSFPWYHSHATILFSKLRLEEGRTEGRGTILLRVRNERIEHLVKERRPEQRSALQSNLSVAENLHGRKQGNIKGRRMTETENGDLSKV